MAGTAPATLVSLVPHDFERSRTHLCDLDEYHRGPLTLQETPCPGSRRFLVPEEFCRGALIDQVTNPEEAGTMYARHNIPELLVEIEASAIVRGSPGVA